MKKLINVSMVVLALAFGAAALSAQTAGGAQKPAAPAKTSKTAKKSDAKPAEKKMENPCPAGEHLKNAKKKMDEKTNPCVKDKK